MSISALSNNPINYRFCIIYSLNFSTTFGAILLMIKLASSTKDEHFYVVRHCRPTIQSFMSSHVTDIELKLLLRLKLTDSV